MSMRLFFIAWKELVQLRRDRLTLGMIAIMPITQLLLFGYAINTDVRDLPLVVFDQEDSAMSRELVRGLEATGFYEKIGEVDDYHGIELAFRTGEARAGLVIPVGYTEALANQRGAQVQLIVDGSDPQTVASATNTAGALVAANNTVFLLRSLAATGAKSPVVPLQIEPSIWYNPELRTAIFIVPGLIGAILTIAMVMLTAMAIARERERGTLEQLIVSPIWRAELVIGKILPYVLIGYIQMTLILAVGHWVFGVPLVGSLGLLYALSSVFIAANLALGILFSTLAKTQQQAMQMSYFFLLPNILLSGFMFPVEGMPEPAQWLSLGLPLTHFLKIVRGITLRGSTFDDVSGDLVWLSGILLVLVVLASLRFSKKLA
jgi:ABC-2 type transport system permease protein